MEEKDIYINARYMRGKVPELDDNYIEKYIPEYIRYKHKQNYIDEEEFRYNPNHVMTTKLRDTNEVIIIVASKYHGLGEYEMRAIDLNGNFKTIYGHEII